MVHILLIPYFLCHLFHRIHISCDQIISRSLISHSSITVAARGLGWWGRWWEWTAPTIPNPEYKGPWKQKVWTWRSGLIMLDKAEVHHDTAADMSWSLCSSENQESWLQGQVEGPFDWQPRYIFLSILREAISPEANPTFHFSFYAYYES